MTWSSDELARIDSAEEARISSRRGDGTLRPPVTVWTVRLGDDIYTRSVNGPVASWFRGTQVRHDGRIAASGMSKDVRFIDADGGVNDRLDEALSDEIPALPACHRRQHHQPHGALGDTETRASELGVH
jgi:hypothetical protein